MSCLEAGEVQADVVAIQEHHLGAGACEAARVKAAKLGWCADFVEAEATEFGTRGGVGIIARKGIGVRRIESPHDAVHVPRTARQAYWHVGAWLRGGFVMGSLYLHTGHEDDEVNSAALFQA